MRVFGLALLVVAVAIPGGSGGGAAPRGADAPLCTPRAMRRPCAGARVAVDYRIRVSTHCGVDSAYFDGRWWRIDPPQPEGSNWIAGLARLLSRDELAFEADDGRQYAFAPAPRTFSPPSCY